ncbi:MAG: tyrosine-protein phosphatase [Sporichthyaceae bacterium]
MRELRFERVFNIRDVGGLSAAERRTLRTGRLFRADAPIRATDADVEALRALGLRTVIDLRTPGELESRGTAPWTALGMRHVHCPVLAELPAPGDEHRYCEPDFAAETYLGFLDNVEVGRRLWRALAECTREPTLIHCAAGRDRTGVVVALLQQMLGVPRNLVLDDFEASGSGMERLLAYLDEHEPHHAPVTDGHRYSFIRTPPECIAALLDGVDERWGSVGGYLQHLGVEAEAERLRENLLCEAEHAD